MWRGKLKKNTKTIPKNLLKIKEKKRMLILQFHFQSAICLNQDPFQHSDLEQDEILVLFGIGTLV